MNKDRSFVLINIMIPILIGAIIYYLISPNVLFVKYINSFIRIDTCLDCRLIDLLKTSFIRNYFLDMLWGYSLIYILFMAFDNSTADINRILLIAVVFSAFIEALQLIHVIKGTFDMLDIAAEITAEGFAVAIIKCKFTYGGKRVI